jgi:hypothetical protein
MRHSFRMKLLAGVFVPALAFAAGSAYATGGDKMKGDTSANATTTSPATSSGAMDNGMKSGTASADAKFARLDTNHDGKLSSSEVAADTKVRGMWKNLDANNDGTVTKAEFEAHAADLK